MAFTLAERQALGLHGLLPPRFKSQEEQVSLCLESIARYKEDLNKYIYLMGLQVRFPTPPPLNSLPLPHLHNRCHQIWASGHSSGIAGHFK